MRKYRIYKRGKWWYISFAGSDIYRLDTFEHALRFYRRG